MGPDWLGRTTRTEDGCRLSHVSTGLVLCAKRSCEKQARAAEATNGRVLARIPRLTVFSISDSQQETCACKFSLVAECMPALSQTLECHTSHPHKSHPTKAIHPPSGRTTTRSHAGAVQHMIAAHGGRCRSPNRSRWRESSRWAPLRQHLPTSKWRLYEEAGRGWETTTT